MLIALHTAKRINLNLKAILEQMMKLRKYKDGEDEYGIYETERLWKRGQGGRKEDVPTLHFPVYFDPDTENIYIDDEVKDETKSYEKIIPYHTKGVLGRWTWSRQKMLAEKYKLIVKLTSVNTNYIERRTQMKILVGCHTALLQML